MGDASIVNISSKFRRILRSELKLWRSEGLVDVALDPKGRSSLLRIRVGAKTYEY